MGFTWPEFVVSLLVVGLLLALGLPALQMAREASRRMHCSGDMKADRIGHSQLRPGEQGFSAGDNLHDRADLAPQSVRRLGPKRLRPAQAIRAPVFCCAFCRT